jgi:hypothetical protein
MLLFFSKRVNRETIILLHIREFDQIIIIVVVYLYI